MILTIKMSVKSGFFYVFLVDMIIFYTSENFEESYCTIDQIFGQFNLVLIFKKCRFLIGRNSHLIRRAGIFSYSLILFIISYLNFQNA
jgi:hypothetical protein